MELWDLYDKNRIKIGKTVQRGEELPENTYHLVVHICIFNQKGEMLIQQRQANKEGWPGMWDITVGGSALSGETSQQAIEREVKEEIGIELDMSKQRPVFTMNFEYGFDDVYIIQKNINLNDCKLQESEVQNVKWASFEEIYQMIQEDKFIPYHPSLIHLYFVMNYNLCNGLKL